MIPRVVLVLSSAIFLLVLGLLQMAGDVLSLEWLKGIGAATCASPAPKVFSSVRGLETFSTRCFIEWRDADGKEGSLEITPEVYSRIGGPYNRRNVYGAALSYGPVLPEGLRDPVMRFALCGEAPLLRELGVDPASISPRVGVRVRFEPRPGSSADGLPMVVEAPCP